jgi:hypothetical protein
MSYIVVDVESDGPVQGRNSIVCFGAVVVEPGLTKTFYGKIRPISDEYIPEALGISGFSREDHLKFDEPEKVMKEFAEWLKEVSGGDKPILISDNNGYDAAWINWYFHVYYGSNPFGWSSRRIGDIYCGIKGDARASWKHLRKTEHTHNPVDDAMGNAEAILHIRDKMGFKINLR